MFLERLRLRVRRLRLATRAAWILLWTASACGGQPEEPAACVTAPALPEPAFGSAGADYLDLGVRQRLAVGRVDPDLEDQASRDRLYCTGTLIAPGWVLTAAHCALPPGKPLRFVVGEDSRDPLATFRSRSLYRHPTLDLLLLELDVSGDEGAELVAPIPVASSAVLETGEIVELAGFGIVPGEKPGPREHIAEELVEIAGTSLTVDGFGRSGACTHDSGGPLLARAEDGTARVFGVLYGGSPDCLGRDLYTRVSVADPFVRNHARAHCPSSDCGALNEKGRCFGRRAAWCEAGVVRGALCHDHEVCGWDAGVAGYRCIEAAGSSCSGDAYGRCTGAIVERCVDGTHETENCSARGGDCVVDTGGRAACL